MKDLFYLLVIALLLTGYSLKSQNVYDKINDEFMNNSQGYGLLEKMTKEIGHRYTGSPNGIKAEEFCYNYFKQIGLDDVYHDEFIFDGWERGSLSFKILSGKDTLGIKAYSYANVTEFADVSAKLIDLDNGLEDDFKKNAKKIKGNIVLLNYGAYSFDNKKKNIDIRQKALLAVKYRAKGVVFIDDRQNGAIYTGRVAGRNNILPIPAIAISIGEGLHIRQLMKEKSIVSGIINMTNVIGIFPARNVIGVIKGTDYPDEYILIGAHLDSWDVSTGAMDNGIGAATVLDLANGLKKLDLKPKRSIMFVEYMGEEVGLLGSSHLVKRLDSLGMLNNIKCVMNLDISANLKGWNVFSDTLCSYVDSVGKLFLKYDDDSTYKNINDIYIGCASDHQPFFVEGIHSIRPNRISDGWACYHSDCDLFYWVNKKSMINSARYTAMMLYSLANIETFPPKMTSEKTKELVLKLDIKQYLKGWGHWKWGD
ncbi:MAG: hypothetical protein A2X02_09080 [Bacteroidetes bacterium GWF2_29_10]|nr:MAG: hypothetical protein A2X02_09080 [Bacteroidetes bacterium GWF2_29_10]